MCDNEDFVPAFRLDSYRKGMKPEHNNGRKDFSGGKKVCEKLRSGLLTVY